MRQALNLSGIALLATSFALLMALYFTGRVLKRHWLAVVVGVLWYLNVVN